MSDTQPDQNNTRLFVIEATKIATLEAKVDILTGAVHEVTATVAALKDSLSQTALDRASSDYEHRRADREAVDKDVAALKAQTLADITVAKLQATTEAKTIRRLIYVLYLVFFVTHTDVIVNNPSVHGLWTTIIGLL